MTISPSWAKAACVGKDPELFFPIGTEKFNKTRSYRPPVEVLEICGSCPIQATCLGWALKHDEEGVWGGTTYYQRREIRKSRSRVKCLRCNANQYLLRRESDTVCTSCGLSWKTPVRRQRELVGAYVQTR